MIKFLKKGYSMKVCGSLFEDIEITKSGEVYICCACRISKISIGNIFEQPFNDIWNSKLLIKIREEALKGNYLPSFCNKEYCYKLTENTLDEIKDFYKPVMNSYPRKIAFHIGRECNAKCIFCRDEIIMETKEQIAALKNCLDKYYLDICNDVAKIVVNDDGDAFSRFSMEFIKTIALKYSNIKFKLMTNGIAATQKNLDDLGIYNRIEEFDVTINATTRKTHEKIFRVKGYKQLIKNLSYIKRLLDEGKIDILNFNFVINQYNYKEVIHFIKFAKKYNAKIRFTEIKNFWNDTLNIKFRDLTVHFPDDKNHKKFKSMLASPVFDDPNIILSPKIRELHIEAMQEKKNSFFEKLKFYKKC